MTTEESFTISDIKVEGETIHKIKYNSSTIHLLGTSHLNPRYILLVNELINKTAPQVVGVELCRTRVGHRNSINGRGSKPTEFVFNKIPSHMLHAAVGEKLRLTYVYGAVQYEESKEFRVNLMRYKRMRTFKLQTPTKVGKLYIGAEIMEPFKNQIWHADSMESKYLSNSYTNYKILLLDRPVEKTFSDMAEALKKEEKDKIKFYKNYFEDVFLKANVMNSTHLMDNLWAKNAKIRKIFMDDRDRFMAKVIFKAVTKDQIENIVCVIGRSHIEGCILNVMEEEIEKLCEFFKQLNKKKVSYSIEEKIIDFNEKSILADIRNFTEFVKKHGHTEGWDASDHSVYLNIRRNNNLKNTIRLLRVNFPDISKESIIKHDKWYKQYVQLKTLQQRAFKLRNIKNQENKKKDTPTNSSNFSISVRLDQKTRDCIKEKIRKWKIYHQNNDKQGKLKEKLP